VGFTPEFGQSLPKPACENALRVQHSCAGYGPPGSHVFPNSLQVRYFPSSSRSGLSRTKFRLETQCPARGISASFSAGARQSAWLSSGWALCICSVHFGSLGNKNRVLFRSKGRAWITRHFQLASIIVDIAIPSTDLGIAVLPWFGKSLTPAVIQHVKKRIWLPQAESDLESSKLFASRRLRPAISCVNKLGLSSCFSWPILCSDAGSTSLAGYKTITPVAVVSTHGRLGAVNVAGHQHQNHRLHKSPAQRSPG